MILASLLRIIVVFKPSAVQYDGMEHFQENSFDLHIQIHLHL